MLKKISHILARKRMQTVELTICGYATGLNNLPRVCRLNVGRKMRILV